MDRRGGRRGGSRSRSPPRRGGSRERRNDFRSSNSLRQSNVDAFGRQRRPERTEHIQPKFYGLEPLQSLELWSRTRNKGLSVIELEALPARYEEYKAEYMDRLSNAFYEAHHKQQWFIERYGAKEAADKVEALRAWAHKESALFAAQARSAPAAFVSSADLGPAAAGNSNWAEKGEGSAAGKKRPAGTLNGDAAAAAAAAGGSGSDAASAAKADDEPLDAKAILGHGSRAVFIRRVPAWCSSTTLAETIEAESSFERLVLSDPTKNKHAEYFASAWVIFPSAEAARVAARRLHKAVITAASSAAGAAAAAGDTPDNSAAGAAGQPLKFEITAFPHRAKGTLNVTNDMSTASRVAHDTQQALALAAALDREQGISGSFSSSAGADLMDADDDARSDSSSSVADKELQGVSFKSTVEDPAVAEAVSAAGPCALLDLACAYLRRVHLYSYYGGTQCSSEGDLLNVKMYRRQCAYKEDEIVQDADETQPAAGAAADAANGSEVDGCTDAAAAVVDSAAADDSASGAAGASMDEDDDTKDKDTATANAAGDAAADGHDDDVSMAVEGKSSTDTAAGDSAAGTADAAATAGAGAAGSSSTDGKPAGEAGKQSTAGAGPAAKKSKHSDAPKVDKAAVARIGLAATRADSDDAADGSSGRPELAARAAFLTEEAAAIEQWLHDRTLLTDESHARCGIEECGKLFKDAGFVHKHLRNKHADEVVAISHKVALPFLRAAYNADPDKPYPAIPTEAAPRAQPQHTTTYSNGLGGSGGGGYGQRDGGREFDRDRDRDRDSHYDDRDSRDYRDRSARDRSRDAYPRRDRDMSDGSSAAPFPERSSGGGRGGYNGNNNSSGRGRGGRSFGGGRGSGAAVRPAAKHEDAVVVDPRQILSYVDVDAPQVDTIELDYGGAFPPPKKKRKSV